MPFSFVPGVVSPGTPSVTPRNLRDNTSAHRAAAYLGSQPSRWAASPRMMPSRITSQVPAAPSPCSPKEPVVARIISTSATLVNRSEMIAPTASRLYSQRLSKCTSREINPFQNQNKTKQNNVVSQCRPSQPNLDRVRGVSHSAVSQSVARPQRPQSNPAAHRGNWQPIARPQVQKPAYECRTPRVTQAHSQITRDVFTTLPSGSVYIGMNGNDQSQNSRGKSSLHIIPRVQPSDERTTVDEDVNKIMAEPYLNSDLVEMLYQQSENMSQIDAVMQKIKEKTSKARAATSARLDHLMNETNKYKQETAWLQDEIAKRKALTMKDWLQDEIAKRKALTMKETPKVMPNSVYSPSSTEEEERVLLLVQQQEKELLAAAAEVQTLRQSLLTVKNSSVDKNGSAKDKTAQLEESSAEQIAERKSLIEDELALKETPNAMLKGVCSPRSKPPDLFSPVCHIYPSPTPNEYKSSWLDMPVVQVQDGPVDEKFSFSEADVIAASEEAVRVKPIVQHLLATV